MHCPLCGSSEHDVLKKPERFAQYDVRLTQCRQCGIQFDQRSVIEAVYVLNPVTEERERVPLDKFHKNSYRDYLRNTGTHPAMNRHA